MTIERSLIGVDRNFPYVEDVFSTYLYTGNGSTQTITNGIDLSTNGGLVWLKGRSGTTDHALYDTARGATFDLLTNSTAAQTTQSTGLTDFGTTGFTIGSLAKLNTSASTYASWTFRKQEKFFTIATWTGNGTNRTITHDLRCVPGMIIVKRTDTTGNWQVYHNGLTSAANSIQLNLTSAQASATTVWNSTAPTSSVFSVGTDATVNASGGTYVAYLFAASNSGGFGAAGANSVVACGSYTGTGSAGLNVTLGWEPQFVLIKNSSSTGNWVMLDIMRGMTNSSQASILYSNVSDAEVPFTFSKYVAPTATGFRVDTSTNSFVNTLNNNFIYLAIRRGPMKTPTDATNVFSHITSSAVAGTEQTTGFPIDSQWKGLRAGNTLNITVDDRLRSVSTTSTASGVYLTTSATNAEATTSATTRAFSNNGFQIPTYYGGGSSIYWSFKRAPGFFDIVCYTGTGSATTIDHNLGVVPELMIVKNRSAIANWVVYSSNIGSGNYLLFNGTAASTAASTVWNSTSPTSSVFSIGTVSNVNTSSATYVAYLFASCPGVSKVGSYTGSGTTKQIDCGFTSGARFILIKRTDSTGNWYVWDSARGIVSGNDPYIVLNSATAEITNQDYIDPYSAGFEISSTAPAEINASGGSYIYLAIA